MTTPLRRASIGAYILIGIITLLAFGGGVTHRFALDDHFQILDNLLIRDIRNIPKIFLVSTYPGDLYRPVVTATFALTYAVSGVDPLWFHVTNLILHSIVSFLVFTLLRHLVRFETAFVSAIFFAALPIHTEVVSNIYGRTESLAAIGVLGALLVAVARPPNARWLVWAAGLASLGFFSKESALTILLLCPIVSWHAKRRGGAPINWRYYVVLLLCAGGYLWARFNALGGHLIVPGTFEFLDNPLAGMAASERALNGLVLLGRYVSLTIAPVVLSSDYSFSALPPLGGVFTASNARDVALIGCAIWMVIHSQTRRSDLGFGAAWFILAFALTSNIGFPIGTIFGERLSYLPGLGVCVVVAGILVKILEPLRSALLFGALLLCISRSWSYSKAWVDNDTLHTYQIGVSPESAKTQLNYGVVLRNRGDLSEATIHVRRALEIYPRFAQAAYIQGTIYLLNRSPAGATHWFHEALSMKPDHLPTLNALGGVYLSLGDLEGAERSFEKILAMDENDTDALLGLMAVSMKSGNLERATILRDRLVQEQPGNLEFRRLSELLEQMKQGE